MTGISGGVDLDCYESILEEMESEPWHSSERIQSDPLNIGVTTHNENDPTGYKVWSDEGNSAVLFGAIRNEEEGDFDIDTLPQQIIEEPEEMLQKLEGSYQIAVANGETVIIATDLLGTRPIYYSDADRVSFSGDISALATQIDDPTVDSQSVAELLCYEFIIGQGTLIEEIQVIPAASYMRVDSSGLEIRRYDSLDFSAGSDNFVSKVYDRYDSLIKDTVDSIDRSSEVGIWLSGGLDSRLLAGTLKQYLDDFKTYTYDANPGGGDNIRPARKTAEYLGVENEVTPFTPDEFVEMLETGVKTSGGQFSWRHMHSLPFRVSGIEEEVDVLFETSGQGELFGEDFSVRDLQRVQNASSPAEVFHDKWGTPVKRVSKMLSTGVNVNGSIREAAIESPYEEDSKVLYDLHHQIFYPNFHYRSGLSGSKVGFRIPLVDKQLLELTANMPTRLRRGQSQHTLGMTGEPVSELKLGLSRKLYAGLESIPYERTKVAPKYPMLVHEFSHIVSEVLRIFKEKAGLGRNTMYNEWYRNNENFREVVDSYFNDAMDREIFNSQELQRLRSAHLKKEENNIKEIAAVTTAEIWLQQYL